MKTSVYILYSPSTDQFYRGMSTNPHRRIVQHNRKEEMATRNGAPWTLLWMEEKPSRAEAKKLENKLKNLSRQRIIRFMLKFHQQVQGPDELLLLQQLSGC